MRRKLQSLGDLFAPIPTASIRVKTFHSWSLATLQYGGFLSKGMSIWSTSQQETAIRLAISAFRQEEGYPPNKCTPSREAAKGFLRRITRLRQRLVGPEQFWSGTEQRDVWVRYIQLKAMNQAIDFDDMLEQIVRYSLDNDQLRAHIRQQFDHVLVDEVRHLLFCRGAEQTPFFAVPGHECLAVGTCQAACKPSYHCRRYPELGVNCLSRRCSILCCR
jgi:superfamily I DNA/RNA helicase